MQNKKVTLSSIALVALAIIIGSIIAAPFEQTKNPSVSQNIKQSVIDGIQLSLEGPSDDKADDYAAGEIIQVAVEHVHDGDTIWVHPLDTQDKSIKVRIIGIDTPELNHENSHTYAEQAKDYLKDLLSHRQCFLEFDKELHDQYGRTLAHVWLEDPKAIDYNPEYLVSIQVLSHGYAKAVQYKPNTKYHNDLYAAQRYAKQNNIGLWKQVDLSTLKKF